LLKNLQISDFISFKAICRLGLASAFSVHESSSVEEMAKATGMNKDDARRILRHAMSHHIFQQKEKNVVLHTAASRALVEVPLLLGFLDTGYGLNLPATEYVVELDGEITRV
jgi:hypothetical protein